MGCQLTRTDKVSPTFGFRLHISQFISTMSHLVRLSACNSIDQQSDASWRINNEHSNASPRTSNITSCTHQMTIKLSFKQVDSSLSCRTGSLSALTKDLEPFSVHYKLDKILMIDKDLEPVSVHYKLGKILMIDKPNSETNQRIYTQQTINAFQVKEKSFFDMQEFLPIFRGSKFGSNNHYTVLIEGVWTCLLRGAAVTNNNIMNLTHTTSKYPPISS